MKPSDSSAHPSRRQVLQTTGTAAAASILAALPRNVFAADDQTIRLALIGCGGRGAGAVGDALSVLESGPVQLYAAADLDSKPIEEKVNVLSQKFAGKVDVPNERRFLGFEAYKAAVDCLRPGDVAMCTTRAYIRPLHVEYAVSKGINVFMEKPFACDPAGLNRMLRAAREAKKKGVKILCGLQCRHSPARQALIQKIRDGEMGDIPLIRANRLGGSSWMKPVGDTATKLVEQIHFGRIHLLWIGSGHMVDNLIHQIDECCWIKDAWPVSCVAMGGREALSTDCGQNLDMYSMEYTFPDGTKALCGFRRQSKARSEFATFIHGTKRAAQFSGQTHAATVHLFKDQRIGRDTISWTPEKDLFSPWQYEWNDFLRAIRGNLEFNEGERAVYADIASLMGRAAAHTGQEVTWDQVMNSQFAFCKDIDHLTADSEVPVKPDASGHFPIPVPGQWEEI